MDWTQAFTIIGINIAIFIFLMNRIDASKKDLEQKISSDIRNLKVDMNQLNDSTNQRLTDLRTDLNQRLSTIEGYIVPRKIFRFEEIDHKDQPKEN